MKIWLKSMETPKIQTPIYSSGYCPVSKCLKYLPVGVEPLFKRREMNLSLKESTIPWEQRQGMHESWSCQVALSKIPDIGCRTTPSGV